MAFTDGQKVLLPTYFTLIERTRSVHSVISCIAHMARVDGESGLKAAKVESVLSSLPLRERLSFPLSFVLIRKALSLSSVSVRSCYATAGESCIFLKERKYQIISK